MNSRQRLDISVVQALGEQIISLADELALSDLEQILPEYSRLIEEQFIFIQKNHPAKNDFRQLEQLFSLHKNLMDFLENKKKEIKSGLKSVRLGKKMQAVYPCHFQK